MCQNCQRECCHEQCDVDGTLAPGCLAGDDSDNTDFPWVHYDTYNYDHAWTECPTDSPPPPSAASTSLAAASAAVSSASAAVPEPAAAADDAPPPSPPVGAPLAPDAVGHACVYPETGQTAGTLSHFTALEPTMYDWVMKAEVTVPTSLADASSPTSWSTGSSWTAGGATDDGVRWVFSTPMLGLAVVTKLQSVGGGVVQQTWHWAAYAVGVVGSDQCLNSFDVVASDAITTGSQQQIMIELTLSPSGLVLELWKDTAQIATNTLLYSSGEIVSCQALVGFDPSTQPTTLHVCHETRNCILSTTCVQEVELNPSFGPPALPP